MLTGKGKIALVGLAAVAAVAALGSGKKEPAPKAGETWHLVFSIYPDVPSLAEAEAFEAVYRAGMSGIADVKSFDASSNRNTIDIVLKYLRTPTVDFKVGSTIESDPYTLALTERNRIS